MSNCQLYCQFSLVNSNLCVRESLYNIRRDCSHHFVSERDFGRDTQRVCQAERFLVPWQGRTELRKTSHKQCIITSNCQLYCQFSLVNLCGRESLCNIRRDCCHHFVSERDFGRDARGVCQVERSLMSPLAGTKQAAHD